MSVHVSKKAHVCFEAKSGTKKARPELFRVLTGEVFNHDVNTRLHVIK